MSTTQTVNPADELMREGCPVDLHKPHKLYNQLNDWLDDIGQEDGTWSEEGQQRIPELFTESPLATDLQRAFKPGYVVRTSPAFAAAFPNHGDGLHDWAHDITWMSRSYAYEFCAGWRVFGLSNGKRTVWAITGMLFPPYDRTMESWVVFALLDEVLPVKEVQS